MHHLLNTLLRAVLPVVIIFFVISSSSTFAQESDDTTSSGKDFVDTVEIVVHPQDVSEQAGYTIKRRYGELRIYGSVRIAGAYDLNGLTDANNFSTYDIPVGEQNITQPRFFMVPNQTRLGLDISRASAVGKITVKIETDFLGENNSFRIRHAYVESGNFLVGQTWSSFTDVNSIPITVDADGPNSSVKLRTVRLRYANVFMENQFRYVVSLESPKADVFLPDSLSERIPSQFIPDLAGLLRYTYPWGYVTMAGIIRGITVNDTASSSDQILGYGILLAGTYRIDDNNQFLFQGTYGRAISRFITALSNKGLDLIYNPYSNSFEATAASGLMISFSHMWRNDASSTLTFGNVSIYNKDFEAPDAFHRSYYFSGNIFWNPLLGVRLGVEISHGRRINKDGQSGSASRLGFIFYADF